MKDKFSEQELKVLDFVTKWHGEQKRKYTLEPYTSHLVNVALMVKSYEDDTVLTTAALCHDLLEDTECEKMN